MKSIHFKILIALVPLLILDGCAGRRARRQAEEEAQAATAGEVAPEEAAVTEGEAPADAGTPVEGAAPPIVPAAQAAPSAPGSGEEYVLNALNFEVKKMGADLKHFSAELRDLQAKSTMWANPLTIYNKEIILDNGSTIFGKIVYQDEKILKVETLIGYLIVERATVVRIVENIPQATGDVSVFGADESLAVTPPPPANRVLEPTVTPQARATQRAAKTSFSPNVVLLGTVGEAKDRSGNLKLTGEVKNVGGRRADFVKVNFVFRKDWSGSTKALTTFVKGSFHTFESGITSDATVLPGASARFELYIPQSFGTFIGYSYTIDWEDYS
ncbi:MAG: hypothetical protein V3U35_02485 [Candidatus Neomarinimicrobiota bacterium]